MYFLKVSKTTGQYFTSHYKYVSDHFCTRTSLRQTIMIKLAIVVLSDVSIVVHLLIPLKYIPYYKHTADCSPQGRELWNTHHTQGQELPARQRGFSDGLTPHGPMYTHLSLVL